MATTAPIERKDMASTASSTAPSLPTSSPSFLPTSMDGKVEELFTPIRHQETATSVDFEDYFKGPRNPHKHSKWPFFLRVYGSVLPKMIVPVLWLGIFATAITVITKLNIHDLGLETTLLTVTGFVVSLALSFRFTTAYERYMEGRRYWATLQLNCRNLARYIWIHTQERHTESPELGKQDLLAKLAALNLLNAFASSLKHRLRFEPSPEYPDLAPLIGNLHTFAQEARQDVLREKKVYWLQAAGQYLGMPFAEENPRKLVKSSDDNLGNMPLEILSYLGCYVENIIQNKTLAVSSTQGQVLMQLASLTEVVTGVERVLNTPLPIAYSIALSQVTWAYVMSLPFQLVKTLGWVGIPVTMVAGYIILGLAQIGRELEDPFGQDVNDLPLDHFCREIAADIDIIVSRPAPMDLNEWMKDGRAKVLWPLSGLEFKAWEEKSVEEIRKALKAKAASRDVQFEREVVMMRSETLTN